MTATGPKVKSAKGLVDEALAGMGGRVEPPTEAREVEEKQEKTRALVEAAAAGEVPQDVIDLDGDDDDAGEDPDVDVGAPEWATMPEGAVMPPGWTVTFLLLRAKNTNLPKGPDRWCALWNLSEGDEKRAAKRARQEPLRVIEEMAKQTIRFVGSVAAGSSPGEGYLADWGGSLSTPGSVDRFWTEIGAKHRHAIKAIYLRNHTFDAAEQASFFESCVSLRRAG